MSFDPGSIRLRPGELSFPTDPLELYRREGPLVLEVGFGNGAFLRGLARAHPEWNLLGVEIAATSVTRGIGMVRREGLEHVRLVCADARFVVHEVLPPRSLHRVYVNFPDPWPKDRHLERRLLRVPFFQLLSHRLEEGGQLWLTTDHPEYFDYAVSEGKQSGLFDVRVGPAPAETLRTKYAERWQAQQKRIHHVVFAKQAEHPDPHPPRLEVATVSHAHLKGDLDSIRDFEKQVEDIPHGHLILRDLTRSLDGRRLIFQVRVEEADLRQEVLVEARPTTSGVYVELLHFGSPALTRGVKRAVDFVAGWLEARGLQRA